MPDPFGALEGTRVDTPPRIAKRFGFLECERDRSQPSSFERRLGSELGSFLLGHRTYGIASPPAATFSFVNFLVPSTIFFGTVSPFKILSAVSLAAAPPVGYMNVASRMPCLTYSTPSCGSASM